ncbi:progonadoliberin-2 [Electrophorus electricus]|uniref:Progonadoliberin n=1 Tax=Electrophorus electricus TaxID=8005 RepID=A0A4W4GRH6_ELEEL|nr:progonadoliberin-2 [Electrophorus electricus]
MVCVWKLLLITGLLLCLEVQLSLSQHWSHGWYPGGKREISAYSSREVSGEMRPCEAGECSYLRALRSSAPRTILLDAMAREFQKRK